MPARKKRGGRAGWVNVALVQSARAAYEYPAGVNRMLSAGAGIATGTLALLTRLTLNALAFVPRDEDFDFLVARYFHTDRSLHLTVNRVGLFDAGLVANLDRRLAGH